MLRMCVIFYRVMQSSLQCRLFGVTESRLKFRITDDSISIPDCYIIR